MDNSGAIVGPLLAFAILSVFPGDYRKVFLFSVVPGVLGVLTIAVFVKEAKRHKAELARKISLNDFSIRYYAVLGDCVPICLG